MTAPLPYIHYRVLPDPAIRHKYVTQECADVEQAKRLAWFALDESRADDRVYVFASTPERPPLPLGGLMELGHYEYKGRDIVWVEVPYHAYAAELQSQEWIVAGGQQAITPQRNADTLYISLEETKLILGSWPEDQPEVIG